MGMSAWGFFITPVLIAADPTIDDATREEQLASHMMSAPAELQTDIFGDLASLDETAMASASGGSQTAIDIANLGANVGENTGTVEGVTTNNSTNGQIANNMISDNGGITTVFNNTGNGVVMQSVVNVNIFLGAAGPQ
ncbi:hypothetical protein PUV54_16210 [Hyphococcus flavus]|uniref:Uncharacterized protein n=1 Tax=Hyphococcus flavus TaxID=1866326 RepID=A0AAF0CEL6_9PROT|nr:hypothetical protein [Hyphococcus flavus]WDI31496.1 hypothetical protein PUV54_16210 [Hyphococcus flavus]